MENRYKEIIIGIMAFFVYFFASLFKPIPFILLNIDTKMLPEYLKTIYNLGYQLFILSILIFLFKNELKKDIPDMKKNYKNYFKDGLKYYFLGFGIMTVSNTILISIVGNIAENEQTVRYILQNNPIYMIVSAILIGPLTEELLFRGAIRKFFKEKWTFILMSGFFFGFLHVMSSIEEINTIEKLYNFLYIIPYSSFGLVFAYMYQKYDNILVSTGFHFMHNFLALSIQILISVFL